MSISSAPSSTALRTSAIFSGVGYWPDGKPVATAATLTPVPSSRSCAVGTRVGYTQTAAPDGIAGSLGSGRIAFELSAATFPGVSAPSSVVRSVQRIASSSAQTFASFLIERLARLAARSSSATASIEPIRGSLGSSGSSETPGGAGAAAIRSSLDAAGLLDRAPRLHLVRVLRVAADEVGERHRERPVLHLPDVAELVREQVVVAGLEPAAEQDRPVRAVAVEAAEPRQPEEPRDDEHADVARRDRARIELDPVEPRLRARERVTRPLVHGADASVRRVKQRILRLLQR